MKNRNLANTGHSFSSRQAQQGGALLMMVLAIVIISTALSYQYFKDVNQKLKRQNNEAVNKVLLEAKESLLAFAAAEPHIYSNNDPVPGIGHFPCPDFDGDGKPNGTSCNGPAEKVLGRFPYQQTGNYYVFSAATSKHLAHGDGRDSIWYALTGHSSLTPDFRMVNGGTGKPRKEPLNSGVVAQLLLKDCDDDGVICFNGEPVVAVLALAGTALPGQSRSSANLKNDYQQYLEQPSAPWQFSNTPMIDQCGGKELKDCFNDKVIAITVKDWVDAMEKSITADTHTFSRLCLSTYPPGTQLALQSQDEQGNTQIQLLDPLPNNHWLLRNKWQDVFVSTCLDRLNQAR